MRIEQGSNVDCEALAEATDRILEVILLPGSFQLSFVS
jgi:hypothetical protein